MVSNTMRRVLLACWVFVALTPGSVALTPDEARTRLHAEEISSFHPRLEGSAGERALISYLRSSLIRSQIETTVLGFSQADNGHSFSSVVEAVVPGSGSGTLMLVVPLSHPEGVPVENDGTAALAAALAVLESAAAERPHQTIRVIFAGAERTSDDTTALGTSRYLENYFPEGNHALLYLDLWSASARITTGANGTVTPSWLVQETMEAAGVSDVDMVSTANLNQVHRLGISKAPEALRRYLEAGIPALYLESTPSGLLATDPTEEAVRIAGFLGTWVDRFAEGVPAEWDLHYLQFRIGSEIVVVREPFFVGALVAVLLAALLYALVYRRRFSRYLRTIARNLWNLPLLFFLIFLFLSASTYAVELLLLIRGFDQMWTYYPLAYVSLKALLALLLFTVASQLLRSLPLSKNGSFYSASALFVLFLDIVIFSVVNLSFGHYFIWAFAASFIFSIVPSRALKLVALILAPALLVQSVVSVLRTTDSGLTELLLRSSLGDLFLSFVVLPFMLMLIRLDFLFRHPVKGKRSFALRVVSVVTGLSVVGIVAFLLVSSPFSRTSPQPVEAVERVDYPNFTRTLELASPAPLGEVSLLFAGERYQVQTGANEWTATAETLPDVLSVRLSYERFIDRERAELIIDAPGPVQTLEVRLFSEEPLLLYDVSFPFAMTADQREATIFIGNRPPLPLVVDYTVAADRRLPGVEVVAFSTNHPDPLEITGTNTRVSSRLEVITRFEQ